jgi:CheY-like chemotaxis protein
MKDLGRIIWPRQTDSRYGGVSDREGQVVFNRSAMAAAVLAMLFWLANGGSTQTVPVGVWLILIGTFLAGIAWGRHYYKYVGAKLPARVLIVEDDAGNRKLLSRAVRARGWDVDEAETLCHATGLLERNPAVVIADIGLPDGCGLDLFVHLRTGKLAPRTVVLTGASDPEMLARIQKVGPSNVIYKPIADLDILLDCLGDPLAQPQAGS